MRSSIVFFIAFATLMISVVHAYSTENKRSNNVSGEKMKVKRQILGGRSGRGSPAAGRGNAAARGSRGTASPASKPKGSLGGLTGGLPINLLGGVL